MTSYPQSTAAVPVGGVDQQLGGSASGHPHRDKGQLGHGAELQPVEHGAERGGLHMRMPAGGPAGGWRRGPGRRPPRYDMPS